MTLTAPIHVLHVIRSLEPSDAADMLRSLIASLDPSQIRATIVTLIPSKLDDELQGAKVVSLAARRAGPGPLAFSALGSLIRALKPDILETWDYPSTLIGTIAHRLSGPTAPSLVWTLQSPPPTHDRIQRFLPGLLALFSDWPQAIIAKTDEILGSHAPLGYHSENWRTIGYTAKPVPALADRQTLREEWLVPETHQLVIQVTGDDWVKDAARFLRAAKALSHTETNLCFGIIGPAGMAQSDQWKRMLAEMAPLPPIAIRPDDGRSLWSAADLVIAPQRPGESLPNIAISALGMGIGCITQAGPDADQMIDEPRLVVPPDDSAALSGAIRRFLHLDPAQRAAALARLQSATLTHFSSEAISGHYRDVYVGGLAERRQAQIARQARLLPGPHQSWIDRLLNRGQEGASATGTVTRTLAGTIILVAIMTAIGRSATFIREIMVAAAFGTGPELEAYFLALAIPTFLTVSATAAIPAVYARISRDANDETMPFVIGRMSLLLGMAALATAGLLTATAPYCMSILGQGLPDATRALAIELVPWVCAIVPSQVLIALWTIALNLKGRFAWPALLSALTPFGVVFALLVSSGHASAETLAYGTASGALVETLVIVSMCLAVGIRFRLTLTGLLREFEQMARETSTVVLGTISLGFIPLADQIVSAQVGPGNVGAFVLGSKIVASITGISAIALSQAVIPRISQLAASGDRLALVALSRNTIVMVAILGLLASGAVSVFSEGIVEIVYARGRFGAAETEAVAAAQAAYAWHIAPFLIWTVISRILVTLGVSRVVLALSAMAAAMNLAIDLAVVHSFGVPGVAFTTTLTFSIVMAAGLFNLRRVYALEAPKRQR